MNPEAKEFLSLFAEIAIATVALSGIIMVLAVSGRKLATERVLQIAAQLRTALIVTVFSLLPLLMTNFDLYPESIWRIVSGLLITLMLGLQFLGRGGGGYVGDYLPKSWRIAGPILWVSSVALQAVNLWLAAPWPVLVQLMVGWVLSILLFLEFIYQVLSENAEET